MSVIPASATVTGVTGPAQTMTSRVFPTVTKLELDFAGGIARVWNNDKYNDIQLSSITTITDTITSGVHAIVIS